MTPRNAFPVILPLLCLGIFGCGVKSKNPLSDPTRAKADERLIGLWKFETETEVSYFTIGKAYDTSYDSNSGVKPKGIPAGMMAVSAVGINKKSHVVDAAKDTRMMLFPTFLGDNCYLNLVKLDENAQKQFDEGTWTWRSSDIRGYLLGRYDVTAAGIAIYEEDNAFITKAVESRKIKGTIDGGCEITETTDNLVKFVTAEGDRMFKPTGRFAKKLD